MRLRLLAWPVVCGATVAEKTRALSFVDGVLVVAVPDAAWRNQLQLMYQQYLAGLNQMAGQAGAEHFIRGGAAR